MPGALVDLKVTIDDKQLQHFLRIAELKGKDLRPALKKSGVWMIRSIDRNFRARGRPRWNPLAPNTIAKRGGGNRNPLQKSGMLKLSTLSTTGKGSVYTLSRNSLKMGSALVYAATHQAGTSPSIITPKRARVLRFITTDGPLYRSRVSHPGIPARPFLLFQKEDVEEIKRVFKNHIIGD